MGNGITVTPNTRKTGDRRQDAAPMAPTITITATSTTTRTDNTHRRATSRARHAATSVLLPAHTWRSRHAATTTARHHTRRHQRVRHPRHRAERLPRCARRFRAHIVAVPTRTDLPLCGAISFLAPDPRRGQAAPHAPDGAGNRDLGEIGAVRSVPHAEVTVLVPPARE